MMNEESEYDNPSVSEIDVSQNPVSEKLEGQFDYM